MRRTVLNLRWQNGVAGKRWNKTWHTTVIQANPNWKLHEPTFPYPFFLLRLLKYDDCFRLRFETTKHTPEFTLQRKNWNPNRSTVSWMLFKLNLSVYNHFVRNQRSTLMPPLGRWDPDDTSDDSQKLSKQPLRRYDVTSEPLNCKSFGFFWGLAYQNVSNNSWGLDHQTHQMEAMIHPVLRRAVMNRKALRVR